jgi:hypothetical protein
MEVTERRDNELKDRAIGIILLEKERKNLKRLKKLGA